jgi:charged multivesicular body protein 4
LDRHHAGRLGDGYADLDWYRDELREQNALSEEIVNAITSNHIGEVIDDDELEDELDQLQQEKLDEDILKTGSVPVADIVHKMPSVANQERKLGHAT